MGTSFDSLILELANGDIDLRTALETAARELCPAQAGDGEINSEIAAREDKGHHTDDYLTVSKFLSQFGWVILEQSSPRDVGYDLTAVGSRTCLRVEIKHVRRIKSGPNTLQAPPITENQRKTRPDAVAVVFDNGAVMVYPFEEYVMGCSELGYKQFTWLNAR